VFQLFLSPFRQSGVCCATTKKVVAVLLFVGMDGYNRWTIDVANQMLYKSSSIVNGFKNIATIYQWKLRKNK